MASAMTKEVVIDLTDVKNQSSKSRKRVASNKQASATASPKLKEGKRDSKEKSDKEKSDKENAPPSPALDLVEGTLDFDSDDNLEEEEDPKKRVDDDDNDQFKTPVTKRVKLDPQAPKKLR